MAAAAAAARHANHSGNLLRHTASPNLVALQQAQASASLADGSSIGASVGGGKRSLSGGCCQQAEPIRRGLAAAAAGGAIGAGTSGGTSGSSVAVGLSAASTAASAEATAQHSGAELLPTRSVLRIFGIGAARSYVEPWKVLKQEEWTGSGFAVRVGQEKLVLTNAHVVDNASLLRVSRHGESKKQPARLVCIAHDIDLALLQVQGGEDFLRDVPEASFKEVLPRLYSEVKVVGFPQGGSTICVTKGVVSRIDAQEYVHPLLKGVCTNKVLIIQIDAAINPGNSGGPAFDPVSGMAIGVASSGMPGAQNIGYIIPACIAQNFITSYARSCSWRGLPEVGFLYRRLENQALRRFLGLAGDETGIEVHSVAPKGALAGKLKPGDVLLKIDGYEVSSEGTVSYEVHEEKVNLSLEFLITKDLPGVPKRLSVMRDGKTEELAAVFGPIPSLVGRFDRVDCEPTYLMIGGFVFSPLSFPMLQQDEDVPENLMDKAFVSWQEDDEQIIVQQRGLKHRINEGYDFDVVRRLVTVQMQKVNNMADLIRSVGFAISSGAEYLAFGFESGCGQTLQEVLPIAELADADAELLELHQIPACVSPNLLELYRTAMPNASRGVLSTLMKLVRCGRSPSLAGA